MKPKDENLFSRNLSLKEWAKANGPYLFSKTAKLAFSNRAPAPRIKKNIKPVKRTRKNNLCPGKNIDFNKFSHVNGSGWNYLLQDI